MSGRGCTHPGGSSRRGSPSHAPVEAPCSALAVDTVEEWLCPCKCGSAMLRAGDKQLRAAPWPYQPQGALELNVWPRCNTSPRESRARGLGTRVALGSRPSVRHPTRSPGPGRSPLSSRASARAKVWRMFAHQGGLLSIATQEPNWSHSPSLLGPSWSPLCPTAVEVCAGPGSADAEHKADRKKIAKSRSKYYKTYCPHNTK